MSALYRNLKRRLCGFNGGVRVQEGEIVVAVAQRNKNEICFLDARELANRCPGCTIILLADGRLAMATTGTNGIIDTDIEEI